MSLEDFIIRYPELSERCNVLSLHKKNSLSNETKLSMLIESCWSRAGVLYVQSGIQSKKYISLADLDTYTSSLAIEKLILVVDEGASLVFYDRPSQIIQSEVIVCSLECWLLPHAQLHIIQEQDFPAHVLYLAQARFFLNQSSQLLLEFAHTGTQFCAHWLDVDLQGLQARTTVEGAYALSETQHMAFNACIQNNAPHTSSLLKVKGAVRDNGNFIYRGTNTITDQAKFAYAHQENKNLVLSETSRVQSIPNLKVATHEVQCGHGSAIGQLDEEHLFYLQSRGMTNKQAKKLLLKSFFADVFKVNNKQKKLFLKKIMHKLCV